MKEYNRDNWLYITLFISALMFGFIIFIFEMFTFAFYNPSDLYYMLLYILLYILPFAIYGLLLIWCFFNKKLYHVIFIYQIIVTISLYLTIMSPSAIILIALLIPSIVFYSKDLYEKKKRRIKL